MLSLEKLQLHIFDPQMISQGEHIEICDLVYKHWYQTWSQIFESKGLKNYPQKIQFIRQNFITVITYDGDVAGYMFNTYYNLKSFVCRDNPVFKNISDSAFQKFKKNNLNSTISIEYLTLTKNYRREKAGFPIGEALMGVCVRLADQFGIDSVFGTAREDYKVDAMTRLFGAEAYQKNFEQYNLPCSLMVASMQKVKPHPNPFTEKIISSLWEKRQSHTTTMNSNNNKKAMHQGAK